MHPEVPETRPLHRTLLAANKGSKAKQLIVDVLDFFFFFYVSCVFCFNLNEVTVTLHCVNGESLIDIIHT